MRRREVELANREYLFRQQEIKLQGLNPMKEGVSGKEEEIDRKEAELKKREEGIKQQEATLQEVKSLKDSLLEQKEEINRKIGTDEAQGSSITRKRK